MHIFNNVLPYHVFNACIAFWPSAEWFSHFGFRYNTADQKKVASKCSLNEVYSCYRLAFVAMADKASTAIAENAFPDFSLHASGLFEMRKGDFVKEHVDAQKHQLRNWLRVASTVLYLNGGKICVDAQDIEMRPNSMIVFDPGIRHEVKPVEADLRQTLNLFWWKQASETELAEQKFSNSQF